MKIRMYANMEERKMVYLDTSINRIRVTKYIPRIYNGAKYGIRVALKWIQDTTGYMICAHNIKDNIELLEDMEEPESLIKRLKIGVNIEEKIREYIEESYRVSTYIRSDEKEVIKITFKTKDEYIKCEFEGNGYRRETSEYMRYYVKQIVRELVYGKIADRYRRIDKRIEATYFLGDCKIVKAEHNAEKQELVYECLARCEFEDKEEYCKVEDSDISNAEQLKYVALFWDNKGGNLIVYHLDTYKDEVTSRNKDDVIKNIGEYCGINKGLVIDTEIVLKYLRVLIRREVTDKDIERAIKIHNEYGDAAIVLVERQLRNGTITNKALDACKYRARQERVYREIKESTGGQIVFDGTAPIKKYGTLVDISCIYEVACEGDTAGIVNKWKKEIIKHSKNELLRHADEVKKVGASVEKLRISKIRLVNNRIYIKFESQLVREIRNRTISRYRSEHNV